MRHTWIFLLAMFLAVPAMAQKDKVDQRLENSGAVITEILNIPDNIPQSLLDKARCVIILPSVLKGAFIFGASYGRGDMVCRRGKTFDGPWGPPVMMMLAGGSFGFQIGGQATDFVLLVMNNDGAKSLLSSKVKLGADASVAAGPVGRNAAASTDAYMRSEILTYSRARGVFAGISLAGSTLRPDNEADAALYGHDVSPNRIIAGDVPMPGSAAIMIRVLSHHSPRLNP
ncbi:MAG TPA: lipid-binding SYLF domain-containing protein [Candidatus Dormibacteraeota bacterium]|nr:lipid-binding SYLF domain-containing protein [Candidatus Dormibacteraeota bacterium]